MGDTTILSQLQKRFLELVIKEKTIVRDFYWTGGTVLSEFYLHHRDSEDIDLFTDREEIRIGPVKSMISKFGGILEANKIGYTQYLGLHTFTFYFDGGESLKVDFNYYPFTRLEKGGKYGGLVRDFIDLYMIIKKYNFSVSELIKIARSKFDRYTDPVQLAGKFLMVRQAMDLPKMRIKLSEEEWRSFFEDQAMKLESMVF
ncbi:nucleotidyl transferase AbiEii/AbiGii toxin family protein [Candidatus Amesbacteria bacterium]|nr:nucleotidyl transferase AbiEii/AbiGii toxin family protein [Candidatus Amesbacteria bacterium]